MGAEVPKQYLELAGRRVIEHSVERFSSHPRIAGIVVAVSPGDRLFDEARFSGNRQPLRCDGGRERFESVLNGLDALRGEGAAEKDWVMVHDAVRPCLRREDIDKLIDAAAAHPVGGVLGTRARDTMKRADEDGEIRDTVNRADLWHAFTPQMFRLGALADALRRAIVDKVTVTDESQAMERIGAFGRMVEGHSDNVKITTAQDLELAARYLGPREAEH